MRMLVQAKMPNADFNAAVRNGSAGQKIKKILDDLKPESVWFTDFDGMRCAMLIVNIADASRIPSIAEPWFLNFSALVEFHPVMSPEDLAKAGLDELGKKWG